jgi:ribonuclease HII
MMRSLAGAFPAYGFRHNVGYATAMHRAALSAEGPCPYHRATFAPVRAAGA